MKDKAKFARSGRIGRQFITMKHKSKYMMRQGGMFVLVYLSCYNIA
jgi:hypothetical protein